MESIIKEAISRAGESPMPVIGDTDRELLEILKELKTNIVVIGCGGSGSNTIQRISDEGIIGAELYAINTDAQHLLSIQVKEDPYREKPDQGAWRRKSSFYRAGCS